MVIGIKEQFTGLCRLPQNNNYVMAMMERSYVTVCHQYGIAVLFYVLLIPTDLPTL